MRLILALLFLAHGIAHLPGFIVAWQLRTLPDIPYHTTVLGGAIDLGRTGIRLIGVGWLATAIAFVAVAAAALLSLSGWQHAAYGTIAMSLGLCALGWPDSRFGVLANSAIAAMVVAATRVKPS